MTKKPPREGIGEMLSSISLAPTETQARPGGNGSSHPMGPGFDFEETEDVFMMDPRLIVLEGKYVRRWFEDAEFADFCDAVRENGDIGQAIGVRRVGPPADQRFVLIYGMRRLKASQAAGLDLVPVRDYGAISEDESVVLQMQENELRSEPHPVDTAYGYWLMVDAGSTQSDLAQQLGKDKGYVSIMVRAGEAIALLAEEERAQLYRSPAVQVRAFQQLVKIKDLEQRRDELLRLARGETTQVTKAAKKARNVQESAFYAKKHRDGRTFRVRWRDANLQQDPEAFVDDFASKVAAELQHLAERLEGLEAAGARSAAERARSVAEELAG